MTAEITDEQWSEFEILINLVSCDAVAKRIAGSVNVDDAYDIAIQILKEIRKKYFWHKLIRRD